MEKTVFKLIDEAIKLEYNMSKLYGVFSEYLDEDRIFWNRLESEEKNHAALLKTAKEFIDFNRFPKDLIPIKVKNLIDSNKKVLEAIDSFILNPARENAFRLAVELENSAGENHFQHFMESDSKDKVTEIFQHLNRDDKNHAERITKYWKDTIKA
jgi:hypothetical protein